MIEDNEGTVPFNIASFNGFLDVVQASCRPKNINPDHADHDGKDIPSLRCSRRATSWPPAAKFLVEVQLQYSGKDKTNVLAVQILSAFVEKAILEQTRY